MSDMSFSERIVTLTIGIRETVALRWGRWRPWTDSLCSSVRVVLVVRHEVRKWVLLALGFQIGI
jgi:hypothetical protein